MQKCLFPLSIFKILSPHRYLLTFSLTSHFSTPSQSPYSIPHSFFSPPLPLPPPSLGRSAGGRQWQERRDAPGLLLHSPVGARRAGVAAAVTSSASDGAGMAVLGFFFLLGNFIFFAIFCFRMKLRWSYAKIRFSLTFGWPALSACKNRFWLHGKTESVVVHETYLDDVFIYYCIYCCIFL